MFKAGFSKAEVNPPLGMMLEGLGQKDGARTIHDDLFVRALYLQQGKRRFLFLAYDLLFFERAMIDRCKGALGAALDLAPAQILINHSHTHAGPRLTHWAYSDGAEPAYLDEIVAASVAAALAARAAARPATITGGLAHTQMPVSRRWIRDDQTCAWAPSRKNSICDAVPFFVFRGRRGQVLSVLFSVSCHPSTYYDSDISADYPGAAVRRLNAHFATDGALFLQGTGGDAKARQIAVEKEYFRRGTWDDVEAAGAEVAAAVVAAVGHGLQEIAPDLAWHLEELAWPLLPAPGRAQFEAVLNDPDEREPRRRWARDMLRQLDRRGSLPDRVPVSLHAVRLGAGARLIGLEGEAVGDMGNLILRQFAAGGVTAPLGYTDGCQLYLPVTPMLPQHGYEVDSFWEYHHPAQVAPDAEQRLLDALHRLQAAGFFGAA